MALQQTEGPDPSTWPTKTGVIIGGIGLVRAGLSWITGSKAGLREQLRDAIEQLRLSNERLGRAEDRITVLETARDADQRDSRTRAQEFMALTDELIHRTAERDEARARATEFEQRLRAAQTWPLGAHSPIAQAAEEHQAGLWSRLVTRADRLNKTAEEPTPAALQARLALERQIKSQPEQIELATAEREDPR